jgi:hypothetical protein
MRITTRNLASASTTTERPSVHSPFMQLAAEGRGTFACTSLKTALVAKRGAGGNNPPPVVLAQRKLTGGGEPP